MFRKNHEVTVQAIINLRESLEKYLPIQNSLIAYDMILLLCIHNYSRGNITVKQFFNSLPHSATAIRYHYKRFIKDGWIENYMDPKDKRIKHIRPTQKLIEAINFYMQDGENVIMSTTFK